MSFITYLRIGLSPKSCGTNTAFNQRGEPKVRDHKFKTLQIDKGVC